MSFRNMPDCYVPVSELRCEAMTQALGKAAGWQDWRRESHRCVRKAVQGRDGRSVCAIHARVDTVEYWSGQADRFPHPFRITKS